jgi:hypothetical protein
MPLKAKEMKLRREGLTTLHSGYSQKAIDRPTQMKYERKKTLELCPVIVQIAKLDSFSKYVMRHQQEHNGL